jgi:hypothetical protein
MAAPFHAQIPGTRRDWRARDLLPPVLLFALCLLAYLRTMRPTFGWGDSSELTTAAYFFGVGHSPGYPTWMLIAYPFSHLPIGEVAFRVNLMNALLGALGVSVLYLVYRAISGSRGAAFIGALAFAFSATFWDTTTEADVFTLHVCLAAVMVLVVLRWRSAQAESGQEANPCPTDQEPAKELPYEQRGGHRNARPADRWLYLLAWLVGISLGNHALTLLMAPALIYLVWAERGWRFFAHRRVLFCLGFLVLGLSVYVLLPIRAAANPPPYPNNPHSLADLWNLMTAPGARQSMFSDGLLLPARRAVANFRRLGMEFGIAGCALALVGLGLLWRRDRKLLVFLALIGGVDVAYACNFSIFDIYLYYLPLDLAVAGLVAAGAAAALELGAKAVARAHGESRAFRPAWQYGLTLALLLALPFTLFSSHLAKVDGSRDLSAELFGRAVLREVEPGAVVMADWWCIGPLWYLKHVGGQRRDVTLLAAASVDTDARFNRLTRKDVVARYPVAYFVEEMTYRRKLLQDQGYWLVPEGPVSRVLSQRPKPEMLLAHLPPRPTVQFGGQVGLVRAEVEEAELRPGECLDFTLYWTPLAGYERRPIQVVTVLQNRESGRVWQEINLLGYDLLPPEAWRGGQVLRERHRIYPREPAPPGKYDLLLWLRVKGKSSCLACDKALAGSKGREYHVASVQVTAAQPPAERRVPGLVAWLNR